MEEQPPVAECSTGGGVATTTERATRAAPIFSAAGRPTGRLSPIPTLVPDPTAAPQTGPRRAHGRPPALCSHDSRASHPAIRRSVHCVWLLGRLCSQNARTAPASYPGRPWCAPRAEHDTLHMHHCAERRHHEALHRRHRRVSGDRAPRPAAMDCLSFAAPEALVHLHSRTRARSTSRWGS